MKTILIVSYLFAPNNSIGALRPTKMAKLLSEKGHCIDVVSAGYLGNDTLLMPNNIRHWYHLNEKKAQSSNQTNNDKTTHNYVKLPKTLKQVYRTRKARKSEKQFYKYFKNLFSIELEKNNYDVIITSFGPLVSLECGLYVKQHCKDIKWICDFRDPVITDITPIIFRQSWKRKEQHACEKADEIIAVSNEYVRRICGKRFSNKAHMIPNGYDLSDMTLFASTLLPNDFIRITYVGSLYEGRRKITPLFRALRELADEGKVDLHNFCFDYAGGDGSFLRMQADEFGLDAIVNDHQLLSREDCLKLQFASHLLVLATWNYKGEEGVFPGKFLEYMLIGRPIISLTTGNVSNGEVTSVMREGQFGVAYESANDSKDMVSLKNYLEFCYTEWSQKKIINAKPVKEVLERYNYDNIINRIEELILRP